MKALKYILLLLLIVVIALGIFGAVQPNEYDVKRTQLVKAPIGMVFDNVNEFKTWETWGPWMEEDPTIEVSYSDKTSGEGASYSWTSKDGPGNMKTVAIEPNKSIAQKLQFGDYEPSDTHWTFEEVPEGTNVTWQMKADNVPFMFKLFGGFSGGMDNMLGPMLERGLVKMDSLMQIEAKAYKEKMANAFTLSSIEEGNVAAQKFIGFHQKTSTVADHEAMTKLYMEYMPKAGEYAMSKLGAGDFVPGTVTTKWDEATKEAEFYIGVLLKKDLAPAEGMTAINLPSSKTVEIKKYGNYGTGDAEAHEAIAKYMESKNLKENGNAIWELYVNDPTQVKPGDIQTDIYYPVK